MNIILKDGTVLKGKSPITMCTGYKAKSLIMQKGDFENLRRFSQAYPEQFNAIMLQLEGRFS